METGWAWERHDTTSECLFHEYPCRTYCFQFLLSCSVFLSFLLLLWGILLRECNDYLIYTFFCNSNNRNVEEYDCLLYGMGSIVESLQSECFQKKGIINTFTRRLPWSEGWLPQVRSLSRQPKSTNGSGTISHRTKVGSIRKIEWTTTSDRRNRLLSNRACSSYHNVVGAGSKNRESPVYWSVWFNPTTLSAGCQHNGPADMLN